MTATTVGISWLEVLVFLLGGGGLLGLPPGERDTALLKAAPRQSLMYVEWAGRDSGKPGAIGIDGLVADPEIQEFLSSINASLATDKIDDPSQVARRQTLHWLVQLTKHPGSLHVTFDNALPPNNVLKPPGPLEMLARLQIGLTSSAGADAGALIQSFNQMAGTSLSADPQMEKAVTSIGQPITVHRDRDRVIFGFGRGVIERTISGLRGEQPGLDSNPRFAAGFQRVASPRTGSVAWLDVRGTAQTVIGSMGPAGLLVQAVLQGAGADALDFLVSGTGVVEGNVIQKTFIATGGRTDGVMMLSGGSALRREQLRHIPADSDLVLALSLNPGQVVGGIRELVARTTPLSAKVFDQAIKELEAELQLSLGADVFPAFGDAWTAFNSPSQGGLAGTGLIVALEVRNPEKAQLVFDRMMQLLQQSLVSESDPDYGGPYAELKQQAFLNHSIHYLSHLQNSFAGVPVLTPTFCLTRGHLYVSLHPQAMKAHLRSLAVARPGFDTIADRKLSLSSQELLATAYIDGPRATQTFSALAPFLGKAILSSAEHEGFDFDFFAIPSAAALVPYAGDVTLSVARQKDGILLESKNPQTGAIMVAAIASARSWLREEYGSYLEARTKPATPATDNGLGAPAGLGAPEGGVVPAKAVQAPKVEEKPGAAAARKIAPIVIRALVPEGVQPLIPNEVFQKFSQPPSPEVLEQREQRRKMQEERRIERERRRGRLPPAPPAPLPPAPSPQSSNPPVPNPPPTSRP